MDTLEDRLVDRIIDIIVDFRVHYGYSRKLDDPELHERLVTLIRQYGDVQHHQSPLLAGSYTKAVDFIKAMERLQHMAGTSESELMDAQHAIERMASE